MVDIHGKYKKTLFNYTLIDLFAGIGGMRLAFESVGGKCIFSSEWNKFAQQTYFENFGEMPEGDITKIPASKIPDHDVLAGGFPCQPFSIAGVSKLRSLNRKDGFKNITQGTLFFDIARIIQKKKPKAFLLENVKNLASHDSGKTFRVIVKTLRDSLGYDVHYKVIDAKSLVPQHRERIFIVGFRKPMDFHFPEIPNKNPVLADILDKKPDQKYTLTDGVWNALQRHAIKSRERGNGFGYGLARPDGIARTLSARYFKDGGEILIPQGLHTNPRRLTPRECRRLMGFPNSFKIQVSDTQAYRQFGNALVVPLVTKIAESLTECLLQNKKRITLMDFAKR